MRTQYIKVIDIRKNSSFLRNSKKNIYFFHASILSDNQTAMKASDTLKFNI